MPTTSINAFTSGKTSWRQNSTTYRLDNLFISSGTAWSSMGIGAANDWAPNGFSFVGSPASDNFLSAGSVADPAKLAITDQFPLSSDSFTYQYFETTVNNNVGFNFYDGTQGPSLPTNYYDLRTVLRHEFGHALGLCHSFSSTALMNQGIPIGIIRQVDTDASTGAKYLYNQSYTGSGIEQWGSCYSSAAGGSGTFDDNTASKFTFSGNGNWIHSFNSAFPKAYNGSIAYTNVPGARTSLAFNGSRISRVYSTAFNRGTEQIYIDNVLVDTMNSYNIDIHWQALKTWSLPNGRHTIEVRSNGTGYTDTDAFIVNIPGATAGSSENPPSTTVKYVGSGWTHNSSFPSASSGNTSYSKTKEDAVAFTFVGTQVTFVFGKAYNRGYASILIDGVNYGRIDQYSPTIQWQQSLTFSGLSAGYHTIHISATGDKNPSATDTFVDVDRFTVQ